MSDHRLNFCGYLLCYSVLNGILKSALGLQVRLWSFIEIVKLADLKHEGEFWFVELVIELKVIDYDLLTSYNLLKKWQAPHSKYIPYIFSLRSFHYLRTFEEV